MQFLSENFRLRGFALLVGAAIPLTMYGRAVLAAAIGIGFVLLLTTRARAGAWRDTAEHLRSTTGVLILAVLAVWSASAVGSLAPVRSLEAVWRSGIFILIAVMSCAALRADTGLRAIAIRALIALSVISVVTAILAMHFWPELYWGLRLKGWLSTPLRTELKGFSSLAVIMVPLLVYAAANETTRWRIAALSAAAGSFFLVWDSYNRSAVAGFLGILLAFGIALFVRRGLKRAVVAVAVAITGVFAAVVVWLVFSRSFLIDVVPADDWLFPVWLVDFQRQTIWAHALKFLDHAPWFGIGPNTINFTPGANAPLPGDARLHIIPAHPHNWLVEVLVETGGIGFAALGAVLVSFTLRLFLAYRQSGDLGTLAALAVMAGYWVSGLFNFSYWSAWWQMCFVMALALALAGRPRSTPG